MVHLNLAERGSVYRKAVLLAATKLVGGRVLLHLHAAQIVQFHASMGASRQGAAALDVPQCRSLRCPGRGLAPLGDRHVRGAAEPHRQSSTTVCRQRSRGPATLPDDGRFRLLFVGNLLERKGVKDLLRAVAMPSIKARDIESDHGGRRPGRDVSRPMAAEPWHRRSRHIHRMGQPGRCPYPDGQCRRIDPAGL